MTCRNPGSVQGDSFVLEPTFHFGPAGRGEKEVFETEIAVVEPNRSYRCRLAGWGSGGVPFSFTVKVSCAAKYYSLPFVKEKTFHLA